VLLGVTGGVAAYKAAYLARLLVSNGADVRVVLTRNASRFVGADTFSALTGNTAHGSLWEEPGSVLHVALARGSDVAVVAPATANVIARLAHGIADDLLTSTLLEAVCPLVVAPAMHSGMWRHPATQANVRALAERGVRIAGPVEGALAAGDEGIGRMAEPEDVLSAIETAVSGAGDLAGQGFIILPRRSRALQPHRVHQRVQHAVAACLRDLLCLQQLLARVCGDGFVRLDAPKARVTIPEVAE